MVAVAAFRQGDERYVDWEPIGSGGSANVYAVFDRDLGIRLAIKLLKPEICADPRQLESLRREVLISRALRHPNICPIHDIYEGPQGVGVLMDLLEGQDLKQWIAENRGNLLETLAQRVSALQRLAEALVVAHRLILHRDLKPANIFLAGGGLEHPLIMDFGISVLGGSCSASAGSAGTPKYMAPEQYRAPATADHRADLFSFGVIAYELLTDGRIPETSLRDVRRTGEVPVNVEVTPPSRYCESLPRALDRLIVQLVETDREKRPNSAQEVAAVLAQVRFDATSLAPASLSARRAFETVRIPRGTYQVGSRRIGAAASERPRRRIRLAEFAMTAHPITNRQYAEFLMATGYRRPELIDDPVFGGADLPVVGVTWDDARAFASWAGGRLPTEIEWEVAAKAGEAESDFPWGVEPPQPSQANIDRVCDRTTPIGSYPTGRNAWGLWDMCGNVWEWCADPWDENFYRRLADDAEAPLGRGDETVRSLRGGSFDAFVGTGRCSFRGKAPAPTRRADIGFRLAFDKESAGSNGAS